MNEDRDISICKEPLHEYVSGDSTMSLAMRCKFSSVSALHSHPEHDASSTVPILIFKAEAPTARNIHYLL